MTEQPDLSTLPQRMRFSASVLEEVNARIVTGGAADQYRAWWHHEGLRARADAWDAEDRADAEREAEVKELAHLLISARCIEHEYHPHQVARELIKSGWHKTPAPQHDYAGCSGARADLGDDQ